MENIIWIIICMLASVGFVQILGWIICGYHRSDWQMPCYYIAPLPADNNEMEAQLRLCLRRRSWSGVPGAIIVLPERELDEEGRKICERMLGGVAGVFLCYPWELERTITSFIRVQTRERGH